MKQMTTFACLVAILSVAPTFLTTNFVTTANAQTRDQQVLKDRELLSEDENWYYDDLDAAALEAAKQKKPMMVVLRCIP